MIKLRNVTGKALILALAKLGFQVQRVKGSHHFLRYADGRTRLVPIHSGEEIGPGLMTKILRDCELARSQIEALL